VVDEYGKTPTSATAPMCIATTNETPTYATAPMCTATTNDCDMNISCLYLFYNKIKRIVANYDGYFDESDSGNSPALLMIMLVSSWFAPNN